MPLRRTAVFLAAAACVAASPSALGVRLPTTPRIPHDAAQAAKCGPDTGSLETPACEVVSTFDGGEVRSYGAGLLWATTRVEGSYSDASYQGFERCFAYISGTNDQNATIEMTGPVRIQPLDETSSTWKVSFFVPSKFTAGTVPQPTDPTMAIEAPASSYKAVYGPFGGFPGQSDYEADLKKLQASVAAAGIKLANDKDITYAGYSSPFTILGRHQEVWLDVAGPAVESA